MYVTFNSTVFRKHLVRYPANFQVSEIPVLIRNSIGFQLWWDRRLVSRSDMVPILSETRGQAYPGACVRWCTPRRQSLTLVLWGKQFTYQTTEHCVLVWIWRTSRRLPLSDVLSFFTVNCYHELLSGGRDGFCPSLSCSDEPGWDNNTRFSEHACHSALSRAAINYPSKSPI
jgi:hypothetical protein